MRKEVKHHDLNWSLILVTSGVQLVLAILLTGIGAFGVGALHLFETQQSISPITHELVSDILIILPFLFLLILSLLFVHSHATHQKQKHTVVAFVVMLIAWLLLLFVDLVYGGKITSTLIGMIG